MALGFVIPSRDKAAIGLVSSDVTGNIALIRQVSLPPAGVRDPSAPAAARIGEGEESAMPPTSGFLGYRRTDGRVETRNHVRVQTPYGRGQFGDDKLVHERRLVGLGRNPKVAAVAATGHDLTGNNPGQENIRGGLSTIEEKSLGAIAEEPARPGLYVMDAPAFSPESLTGFAASGANLILFTTGAGNSFCNALAPTLKISVRPDTVCHLPHQIDLDGSAILAGAEEIDAAGARLFEPILAVASGERSWGEILDEGDETFIRVGGSL